MPNHTGLSPKDPNKYIGPSVYLTICVTRNRAPTGADYRQPETGKLYPFNSFWLVGKDPTTGVQGDLWYLSKIVANVAFWVKISSATGPAISLEVDTSTPPGTDPVVADVNGVITITGGQVAAGTIANVIRTDSLAANTFTIEIQRASTAAVATVALNGVSHFNSAHFTIDADGFVSLAGGGLAIDSVQVDAFTAPGTNPVVPTAAGLIIVTGAQVAAGVVGTNVIRSNSIAANTYRMEIQRSTSSATTTVANNGVSHYKSTDFLVDANAFVSLVNPGSTPSVANIGIAYSAGTFTVQGSDGTALSATNPGVVWLQDKATPGRLRKYLVTANQTFTDGAGGGTVTQRFGLTVSVNALTDIPFYIYAVGNDAQDSIAFMICRIPHYAIAPATTKIGQSGAVVNTGAGDLFSLRSITIGDYDGNPVINLGAFRMQFTGATNSWTVSTLSNKDGVGQFHESTQFVMPRGQFGAAAGKYFADNGGTAPDDSTLGGMGYYISKEGFCEGNCVLQIVNVAGVGAVDATQALPFPSNGSTIGQGMFFSAAAYAALNGIVVTGGSTLMNKIVYVSNGGTGVLQDATFTLNSVYDFQFYYEVFITT